MARKNLGFSGADHAAAQAVHGCLKAEAGAGAGFVKNGGHQLAFEPVRAGVGTHDVGKLVDLVKKFQVELLRLNYMLHGLALKGWAVYRPGPGEIFPTYLALRFWATAKARNPLAKKPLVKLENSS